MTELAFVLLFTAAGLGAVFLARRVAGDEPVVRWLGLVFCLLALGNFGLYLWRIVARDPAGAARLVRVLVVLGLFVWGYRLLLRRLRRSAERRRP